ncbi:MAG: zinc-ribbon domain-containing protein [Desulfobulbaceae bacterium]|nr:zinc-ribbon domain-containing protein [Desulfobulbaceae bacterium]
MLVFCEECGKRYSFPPEEVEAGSGQFRCRACGFLMTTDMLVRVVIRKEEGILPSPPSAPDSDGILLPPPPKTKEGD